MSYTLAYTGADIDTILGRAAPGGQLDNDIAAKAPLASPALTGDPTAPTQEEGDGSTKLATTEYADRAAASASVVLLPTESATPSSIASFPDGADGIPVKSATFSILPVQSGSGDPAPDNVRPISGWTGAEIWRSARNLVCGRISGYTINASGILSPAQGGTYDIVYAKVEQGEQYIVTSGAGLVGGFFREIPVASAQSYNQSRLDTGTMTVTAPISGWLAFRVATGYATPQVEVGSTATAYDDTLDTILLSFGSTVYAGTITALGGGKWSVQPTHKIDALDSHTWNYGGSNRFNATGFSDMKQDALRSEYIYCSCYAPNVGGGAFDPFTIYNGTGGYLYVVDDRTTDGATLKTLLAGQYMVYPLATLPDPIIIDAEDLVTVLGANNIWADCGDVTELTYRADLALYIQRVVNGDISTLSTLSLSPTPTLTLGRLGETLAPAAEPVALTEDAEPAVTDEDAATEDAEPEDATEESAEADAPAQSDEEEVSEA